MLLGSSIQGLTAQLSNSNIQYVSCAFNGYTKKQKPEKDKLSVQRDAFICIKHTEWPQEKLSGVVGDLWDGDDKLNI